MHQTLKTAIAALGLAVAAFLITATIGVESAWGIDCNANAVEDADDIAMGTSADCNGNQVPDECDVSRFRAGFSQTFAIPGDVFETILDYLDIDGDGDQDLVTYQSMGLSIRLNNGSGQFGDALPSGVELIGSIISETPGRIARGNFRAAGSRVDGIVPVNRTSSPGPVFAGSFLKLFFQDGTNGFNTADVSVLEENGFVAPEGTSFLYRAIAGGDFDGDGLTDLVFWGRFQSRLVVGAEMLVIALNTGNGTQFRPILIRPIGGEILTGDFNEDQITDVVVFNEFATEIRFLLSAGPANFLERSLDERGSVRALSPLVPRMGGIDLLVQRNAGNRAVIQPITITADNLVTSGDRVLLPTSRLFVGDVDGDGSPEAFGSSYAAFLSEGVFKPAGPLLGLPLIASIDAVDINADGKVDLFSQDRVYLNTSTGSPIEAQSRDIDADTVPDQCQRAVELDFDGDRLSNLVVARVIEGLLYWFVDGAETTVYQFGLPGDGIFAADYAGNGTIQPGVVRNIAGFLYWFARDENGEAKVTQWGLAGDFALTGHFDGDRAADLAVVREINGGKYWFIRRSGDSTLELVLWGLAGDRPFTGDLDGDGINELIVARREGSSTVWYARKLNGEAFTPIPFGFATDELIAPIDRNGDGKDDITVARRLNGGILFLAADRDARVPFIRKFGLASDLTLAGSYTVPGVTEYAVFRGDPLAFFAQFFVNAASTGDDQAIARQFGLWFDFVIAHDGTAKRVF